MRAIRRLVLGWCLLSATTAAAQSGATFHGEVRVSLSTIAKAADQAMPMQIVELGAWNRANGWGTRFAAYRTPIQAVVRGGIVHLTTHVEFQLAVCKEVSRPWPWKGTICPQIGSCGLDGSARGSLDLDAAVTGFWGASWTFAPSVSVGVLPGAPCSLTIANVNATPFIANQLQGRLQAAANSAATWNARAQADQLWATMKPRKIAPDVWLAWDVTAVQVGPVQVLQDAIASDFTVALGTRVVTAALPPSNGPLPASVVMGTLPPAAGWSLSLDATWSALEAALTAVGPQTSAGIGTVELKHVSGSGTRMQMTFEKTIAGAPTSTRIITADLSYDPATDLLSVTGIQLGSPADPVLKVLVDALAPKLQVKLGPLLAPGLQHVETALTSAGLHCPSITAAHVASVAITASGISASLIGPGSLSIGP